MAPEPSATAGPPLPATGGTRRPPFRPHAYGLATPRARALTHAYRARSAPRGPAGSAPAFEHSLARGRIPDSIGQARAPYGTLTRLLG